MKPQKARILPITDYVWLGNVTAASSEKHLNENGINRIVSVLGEAYAQEVRSTATKLCLGHKLFCIPDCESFLDNDNRIISEILPWVKEGVDSGMRTLIHCHAGLSRSSSMVLTFLIWNGMSIEQALQHFSEKHPVGCPHPLVLCSFLHCIGKELPLDYQQWFERQEMRLAESRKREE